MDSTTVTTDLLRELRSPRPYPAVSVSMPTHRREPDNEQDGVRLRNVLARAARMLEADPGVPRDVRADTVEQLESAAAEADLRHSLEGLLILADAHEHRVWYLPRAVPERVVLSDTYLTRNLVAAAAQARPYWVLGVAADRATLWSGAGGVLREHRGDGFPMTPEQETWDVERLERIGDTPSTFRDEETRRFLRAVDTAAAAVLARRPRPLFLVGLAPALALLDEAGRTAGHLAAGRLVKGGLTEGPAPALLREVRPVVEAFAARERQAVLTRLDEARGRRTFAGGLDEVWESVREKRAGLIAVEEHVRRSASVGDGHLVPAGTGTAGGIDVRDDIVDELVEKGLDGGAGVVFLPDGSLADCEGIAAVLRY